MAPEVARGRTGELDGARAVAMLSVFAFHYALALTPMLRLGAPHLPLALRGYAVIPNLDMGVEIFFVLSGYLIFRPFAAANLAGTARPTLRDYFVRRALRIFPAYWLALFVLWSLHEITFTSGSPAHVMAHVFLIHTYFRGAVIDGISQSWTLVVELSFYAFVPLLAWALRRAGTRGHVVTLLGLTGVGFLTRWYLLDHTLARPLTVLPPALAALAPGMLVAVLSLERARWESSRSWVAVALRSTALWWTVAAVLFVVMTNHAATNVFFPFRGRAQYSWHDLMAPLVAIAVVTPLALAGGRGVGRALMRSAPLAWVGTVSYGAYLWHEALIAHTPHDHFGLNAGPVAARGIWWCVLLGVGMLAVTLSIAAASWYGLERPVMRAGQRRLAGSRPQRRRRSARTLSA